MKTTKKPGLIFGKISIIDIVIVALALVVMVYGFSVFTNRSVAGDPSRVKIQYTFETNSVIESFGDQLFVGADLYNSSRNHYLGKLVSFEIKPYEVEVKNLEKGIITKEIVPEQFVATLVIEAEAVADAYHYRVTQEDIKIGASIPVKGRGFASLGYVVGLKEVE